MLTDCTSWKIEALFPQEKENLADRIIEEQITYHYILALFAHD